MAEWIDVPVGVGVAILLVREISRFIHERFGETPSSRRSSGDKPVEFWENCFREIVWVELDRHILPVLRDIQSKVNKTNELVTELRWRQRNERKDDA
jgi:hypothetical protein